jgi:hypothetical protein
MKLKQYFQAIKPYFEQKKFLNSDAEHVAKIPDTIVSLTSFPPRYKSLPYVVSSLLNQDSPPLAVHLWVDDGTSHLLPKSLDKLKERGLHIHECEDIGPHKKLINSLSKFPSLKIVTADDDMMYPYHWLSTLYEQHLASPDDICAYTCRTIKMSADQRVLPYSQWKQVSPEQPQVHPNYMSIGYTGVLYPPNTFNEEVFNLEKIKELCPRADDIWFKMMAVLNGKSHRKITPMFGTEIYIPFSQKFSLKKTNVRKTGNEDQANNLIKHYGLESFFQQNL